mmetsp:Transcript_20978/g.52993  ORF Transcript_20978/g.52993 Transcript_20978/m.52993 type:complete len:137 (+) Transcript_20978:376-786(+)|eukprot:CAMPEP_0178995162 /NCGR_PEP_ID=MMETSP0795-20121207/7688_1 /TAXON_ID=88552 /ORGANISM="Amoebophrya sp., Strain Ameob2" /LENGTH=136 /DNA_ID=CAMNT_0020687467 /DNA_START=327 /DNA_END=737 /DNA_ORIENTATION=-
MDKIIEEKAAGAEHHQKKKVYRTAKPEQNDSLIDFSAHIHGDNRFHHTRTHNLNKPRSGKAPRSGYHRPEKMAAGYAKKLDVLPSQIAKDVQEYEDERNDAKMGRSASTSPMERNDSTGSLDSVKVEPSSDRKDVK